MDTMEAHSLLVLNDYCLIEVFKYLDFDASINLSLTCKRLQNISAVALKKCRTFMIHNGLLQKGIAYVESIFNAIGPIMSNLTVNFNSMDRSLISDILVKIVEKCSKLESLLMVKLTDFDVDKFQHKKDRMTNALLNVKKFKIVNCCGCIGQFSGIIRELEALEGSYTVSLGATIQQLLKNNPTIKAISLSNISTTFDLNILTFTPSIEFVMLTFTGQESPLQQLQSSVKLENLESVSITLVTPCHIEPTLKQLANQKRLQNLICNSIHFDMQTSKILQSFDQLMILKLNVDFTDLNTSFVWPPNLRILELTTWNEFSIDIVISIIQQLKFLQGFALNIRFVNEYIANVSHFNDSSAFISKIFTALTVAGNQNKLYFTIRAIADTVPICTTEPIVNSDRLSIIFKKPYYIPGDLATAVVMRTLRYDLLFNESILLENGNITSNDDDD